MRSAPEQTRARAAAALPASAGVGFKSVHFSDIEASAPDVGFFEVHAENYMGAGGPPHAQLMRLRRDYALSIHGVGLSIGGAGRLDSDHLRRVQSLVERYEPAAFSEHLAWSTQGASFLNDLLPLPYNAATLAHVVAHVDEIQEALGRPILLENPAAYLRFQSSDYSEIEFLREIVRRTDCRLLLDVTNAYVSAANLAFSADDYIDAFPMRFVEEIHLAGYAEDANEIGDPLLIDAHCAGVQDGVWRLYDRALARRGPVATLIEWDNDVPPWPLLLAQAAQAGRFLQKDRSPLKTAPDRTPS
ncbi:MAG: MNIO family bufferin maturase [Methylocystis sp.]